MTAASHLNFVEPGQTFYCPEITGDCSRAKFQYHERFGKGIVFTFYAVFCRGDKTEARVVIRVAEQHDVIEACLVTFPIALCN